MEREATKGEQTRAKIAAAGIRLFAKRGYADTSLEAVAKACGLSQGAFFYHFKTKSELVAEILATITRHNRAHVEALGRRHDDAKTRLLRHFEGNIRWAIEAPEEAQVILFLYYLACTHPEFRRTYREVRASAVERIEDCLRAAGREGLLRKGVEVEAAAKLLHDALVGTFVNLLAAELKPKYRALPELKLRWRPLFERFFVT
jgi:TetR/AcrR family acrAB operon transcriptional repressor